MLFMSYFDWTFAEIIPRWYRRQLSMGRLNNLLVVTELRFEYQPL